MNRDEKKLKKYFAQHALGFAVRKQRQKENRLRKAMAPSAPARERYTPAALEAWEDVDLPRRESRARRGPRRPPRAAGRDEAAASRGETTAAPGPESRLAPVASEVWPDGVVLGFAGGRLRVWREGREVLGSLPGARFDPPPAPGDEAILEESAGELRIVALRPRRSELVRPDPHVGTRPLVLAANVDTVVVVMPAGPEPPRPGLVDRMLLAIGRSGCDALVCVSKVDLAAAGRLGEVLERLAAPGAPVVACSARTGSGLAELARRLRHGRAVLVGHSGGGKTSLLNALVPGVDLATGAVRESDARGRHTTSAATLVTLPGGGQVLDTPGVREFGLWAVRREDVQRHFREIARLARDCRFRDCAHRGEPQCAVAAAVASGELDPARLAAYWRLAAEASADRGRAADRIRSS